MRKTFLLVILFYIVESSVWGQDYNNCLSGNIAVSNPSGRLSYRSAPSGTCEWTFTFPNKNNDFVMIFDLYFYHDDRDSKNSLTLPEGVNLDDDILFYNVPPCKVYHQKEKGTRPSDCLFNITNLFNCSKTPLAFDRWPPRMKTVNHDGLRFGLSYHIFPYLINGTVANSTVGCIQSNKPEPNLTKSNYNPVIVILSVLLFLAIVAVVALLFKFKLGQVASCSVEQDQQEIQNNQSSKRNVTYEEIGPTYSQPRAFDASLQEGEKEMAVNVLYRSH